MKRAAALLLLAAQLALSGGCTMVSIGYGHFDTFAVHTADTYFDLEPAQKQEFLKRFERLHEWHRRDQLPDYAGFLADARRRFDRGATREDIAWLMAGVEERYRTIARRGSADAAALLATAMPRQIAALQRQWEKDNDKFVHEHRLDGTPAQQREASLARLVRQIESWTGALTNEQEARVAAVGGRLAPIEPLRHAERLRRQREFIELMALRREGRAFEQKLRHWLTHWEEGRAPDDALRFRDAREQRIDIYLAVARTLSDRQRAHLTERVEGFIGDFRRLAAK